MKIIVADVGTSRQQGPLKIIKLSWHTLYLCKFCSVLDTFNVLMKSGLLFLGPPVYFKLKGAIIELSPDTKLFISNNQ